MHIFFATRGKRNLVKEFINKLEGIWLPFKVNSDKAFKGAKKGENLMNVKVQPFQLWEVVFPRESKDQMIRTLFDGKGKCQHKKHDKFLWGIRKALGVKPIPKVEEGQFFPARLCRNDVEVMGIGIKEDYNFEDGTEGL